MITILYEKLCWFCAYLRNEKEIFQFGNLNQFITTHISTVNYSSYIWRTKELSHAHNPHRPYILWFRFEPFHQTIINLNFLTFSFSEILPSLQLRSKSRPPLSGWVNSYWPKTNSLSLHPENTQRGCPHKNKENIYNEMCR